MRIFSPAAGAYLFGSSAVPPAFSRSRTTGETCEIPHFLFPSYLENEPQFSDKMAGREAIRLVWPQVVFLTVFIVMKSNYFWRPFGVAGEPEHTHFLHFLSSIQMNVGVIEIANYFTLRNCLFSLILLYTVQYFTS